MPWSVSHRTNVFEMQALCVPCNRSKGSRMSTGQDAETTGSPLHTLLNEVRWDALRPGQTQALRVWAERVLIGEKYTSIVLPTRYGKSDVIRVGSYLAWRSGRVFTTLALSPGAGLADQLAELWRFNEAWQRYELNGQGTRVRRMESLPKGILLDHRSIVPNGEMLVSTTIQFAHQNQDLFADWVETVRRATGLPVMVVVDESHTGADDREWGKLVQHLVSRGAIAVLLTATPFREDGRSIPGFRFEPLGEVRQYQRIVTKSGAEEGKVTRQVWLSERRMMRLVADHETTFGDAWAERPSPLCTINHVTFAANVKIRKGQVEEIVPLAQMTASDARRVLGKTVRDPLAIRAGVSKMVDRLRIRRSSHPELAAMVFCGSDQAGTDANAHAKLIEKEIERRAPELDVVIATSNDDDGVGAKRLTAFKAGRGDVLIVKFMAGVGQDIPRIKTVLDLSPVRTMSSCIQRWMRGGTPYKGITTFDLIVPEDVLQAEIFSEWIEGNGGRALVNDLELLEESQDDARTRAQSDPESQAWYSLENVGDGGFDDNLGNYGAPEEHDASFALFRAFPLLSTQMTQAEAANRLRSSGLHVYIEKSEQLVESTSDQAMELYERINRAAKEIADLTTGGPSLDRERWVIALRDAYTMAYIAAGVGPGVTLRDITDLATLRSILRSLEEQEEIAVRQ